MKSIIEELFVGGINSIDKLARTDEYNECSLEIIKQEEEFFEKINEEQRLMFDKLSDLQAGRSLIECKSHFVYAFKAGFRLATEIYNKKDD